MGVEMQALGPKDETEYQEVKKTFLIGTETVDKKGETTFDGRW